MYNTLKTFKMSWEIYNSYLQSLNNLVQKKLEFNLLNLSKFLIHLDNIVTIYNVDKCKNKYIAIPCVYLKNRYNIISTYNNKIAYIKCVIYNSTENQDILFKTEAYEYSKNKWGSLLHDDISHDNGIVVFVFCDPFKKSEKFVTGGDCFKTLYAFYRLDFEFISNSESSNFLINVTDNIIIASEMFNENRIIKTYYICSKCLHSLQNDGCKFCNCTFKEKDICISQNFNINLQFIREKIKIYLP